MKKILYLCGNILPLHSGDAIYSYSILERLLMDNEVDLISYCNLDILNNPKELETLSDKLNYCKFVDIKLYKKNETLNWLKYGNYMQYDSVEFNNIVFDRVKTENYDFVIVDHLRLSYLYKSLRKKVSKDTKLVLVQHNVEYNNFQEEVKQYKFRRKAKRTIYNYSLKAFEEKTIKNFDYIWCISELDKKYFDQKTNNPDKSFVVFPYYQYNLIKSHSDLQNNSYNLIFLGSISWYPNVRGIVWFIENVFYKLIQKDKRYKLYIVGHSPSPEVLKLANDNIIITGRVENVDEFIKKADLMIVPIFQGGGVKIKVMESIMKGLPVIATNNSIVGYPKEIFKDGFCANTPDEFINSIITINGDFRKKVQFIECGRNLLKKSSDITKILDKM